MLFELTVHLFTFQIGYSIPQIIRRFIMAEKAFHEKNVKPDEILIREKLNQAYPVAPGASGNG